jgi:protein-tyrosine phosphatase
MRSPTVIASYLIYKYNMNVEDAIQFIKNKKNFTFNNSYNFKEILFFIKEEFDKELIFKNNLKKD